jgi:hypothetical protein
VLILPPRLAEFAITAHKKKSDLSLVALLRYMARGQEVRIALRKARHNTFAVVIAFACSVVLPALVRQVAAVRVRCNRPVLRYHASCGSAGTDVGRVIAVAMDGANVERAYRTCQPFIRLVCASCL